MHKLVIVFTLFILNQIFGQGLSDVTNQLTPYAIAQNQDIGVLVLKNGKTEITSIGKRNFNEHSVFCIGSATKKMTAILLLQEVEKGNLKLSDSIGKYLAPIKNVDMSLSIELLLRHRSGIGEVIGRNLENVFYAKKDSLYNINLLKHIPIDKESQKGTYKYCNTNYLILGKIAEKITQKSYFQLLQERIFTPANMKETYPFITPNTKNVATPTDRFKDVSSFYDKRFYTNYANAAGSVASTLHDMKLFYENLFEKKTLLLEKSLKALVKFDDAGYGLGMSDEKNGFVGHGGNIIGYSYREYYNPVTKEMILYFSNDIKIPFHKFLKQNLFDYLNGKTPSIKLNKNYVNDYKSALGKYFFKEMNMEMHIIEKDNILQVYIPAQEISLALMSSEKNKLSETTSGLEFEIIPGNSEELIVRQGENKARIQRIK